MPSRRIHRKVDVLVVRLSVYDPAAPPAGSLFDSWLCCVAGIEWLRACQLPGGGFTYQPKPEFAGTDDVAYTRAAVLALAILGAAPADRDACIRALWSLRNADGGFGNRRGAPSNPVAAYYALDALAALRALDSPPAEKPVAIRVEPLPAGLKVFTIQIESHGQGSPAEAVDLACSLRIHL